jgi:hypothetical protein
VNIYLIVDFMLFKKDSRGQGGAEYLLLFGGVIVIAILALLIYSSYFGNPFSSDSLVTITITNNGPTVTSSLRYEVYDKNGKNLTPVGDVNMRLLAPNSTGRKTIGSFPKGSTLKLHESLSGSTSTITTNIVVTAYSGSKIIIDVPIVEEVAQGTYKGARGNWYSGTIS